MARRELPPRLTDWTILAAVLGALGTGLLTLVSGRPGDWVVFAAHGAVGLALVVLLFWKFRRVRRRVTDPARWTRTTAVSVVTAVLAVGALATGAFWSFVGTFRVGFWTGLTVHAVLGVLLVVPLLVHLRQRFRLPAARDFRQRRTALAYLGLATVGSLAWTVSRTLPTAARRFTGSRDAGGAGNVFPTTSWVADDPDPVDLDAWRLRVGGAVERELSLGHDELAAADRVHAVLDCTSGWYAVRSWEGVRVGALLAAAAPVPEARWVRFTSVTGYRWSLPLDEARDALLATHVGGDRLSHGHGRPLRLVAPGRRGFQWVKWVESIELLTEPDYGQWVAVFTSGLDRS